ncbi:uncharacterized protein LOC111086165 isoform X5 [Limulus polyphemus]|uniref:Uncharacterized protein LOC111086165 isoform X5 n=1 Tax=Limulus polyphemus TaxID=6850 RepID=A0ABM1SIZ5_LIMPO|nr:uncharacterized protein LOC111086165 isoform X5 [Limulus polyphemus]
MDRCQTFKLNLLKSKHCGLLSLEDGPPPLEWDGPPPLEWDGPPPLEWDGPPPLELNGPPPLEKDEPPPPLEFDDTSFLEIFYQAERQCHQSVEYRQNNKEIMKLFEVYKPLDVRMIITAPSGTGEFTQALVLLPSPEDAEAAVMKLNNTIFKKRRIVVSTEARDIERACGILEQNNYFGKYNGTSVVSFHVTA